MRDYVKQADNAETTKLTHESEIKILERNSILRGATCTKGETRKMFIR